jgi:hypothetical protein
MDDPTFDPASGEFAAIFREIVDCAAPSVVISSENFQYLHARPDALERMRDSLEAIGYEMRVILYLRPQVEYAESLHAELLKHGLDRSLDALVEEILETGSIAIPQGRVFRFEYGSLLNAFAGVVGPERLLVRRFDRNLPPHALINDFFSLFQWSADDVAALGSAPEPNVRTRETGHRRIRTTELMRFIRRFSADRRLVARQYGVDIPIVQAERVLSGPFGRPPLQA